MVSSSLLLALLPAVAAGPLACKAPEPKPTRPGACKPSCKTPAETFTIKAKSLYPENADFDKSRCVTYISNLYNSTVTVYNAADNTVSKVLTFEGISQVLAYHISGLQRDAKHDMLTISANAGAAFDTPGADVSGTNMLLQYDLAKGALAWQKNLTETTEGIFGGFQDMEHDGEGNAFVIGTYPSSILKVSADGQTVDKWYVSDKTAEKVKPHGFTGIAKLDDRTVLVTDGEKGKLLKFDLTAAKGEPVDVPIAGGARIGTDLDGAYLPPMFKNEVLLASDSGVGTVVLRSKDGWKTAESLGVIPMPKEIKDDKGYSVATVQVGNRIKGVTEYFEDNDAANGKYLTREDYPWYDITDDVKKLVV